MEKICECGKQFTTTQRRIDLGRGKYCSKSCKYKYRKRPTGLLYKIVNENPTWIKKGQRLSIETEFKKGEAPHNFLESGYGYDTIHDWVKHRNGKAVKCEYCGSGKTVQWANKSHEYKRELSDWISLCRICHIKYDRDSNAWGVATKKFNLKGRNGKR